jgi:hypothetical protein
MAAIIRKDRSERKAALYQKRSLLDDIIARARHFGADSYEVGYALSCILELRHLHTALLSLLRRAWT